MSNKSNNDFLENNCNRNLFSLVSQQEERIYLTEDLAF